MWSLTDGGQAKSPAVPGRSANRAIRGQATEWMRRRISARDGKLGGMSSAEQPQEPVARIYTPDEAIRHARPLPARDRLVIDDVPADEWAAFQAALAGA